MLKRIIACTIFNEKSVSQLTLTCVSQGCWDVMAHNNCKLFWALHKHLAHDVFSKILTQRESRILLAGMHFLIQSEFSIFFVSLFGFLRFTWSIPFITFASV